jgi:hypothetical protein
MYVSNTIESNSPSTTQNLFRNATNDIFIGNNTSILNDTYVYSGYGGILSLGTNISGGTINIGNSNGNTANTNIYAGINGSLNIGTNVTTGTINIGTNMRTNGNIIIGNSNQIASTSNTSIFSGRNGILNIGTNILGGTINIGTSIDNGIINIGNSISTNSITVINGGQIGGLTLGTNISGGNIDIGGNNGNINIGTNLNRGNITIGSSTMNGSTTIYGVSGGVTLGNPLTLSTNPPTNITQLGFSYSSTSFRASNTMGTSFTVVFSPQSIDSTPPILLPAGVYMYQITGGVIGFGLTTTGIRLAGGFCYSTVLPMTTTNTTRTVSLGTNGNNDATYNTGLNKVDYASTNGVFVVDSSNANTRYYAGWMGINLLAAATTGNASAFIHSVFITRIA